MELTPLGKKTVITDELDAANGVFMADMDGDGDMDILSASRMTTELLGMKMMEIRIHHLPLLI